MKSGIKLTQDQARGFLMANVNPIVIKFYLEDEDLPLVVTGKLGKPISNSQATKYLDWLVKDQTFTDRSPQNKAYREFIVENRDSRRKKEGPKGVNRAGFMRWIPEGRSKDVMLEIVICDTVHEAVTISKYENSKLPKDRALRRDIPISPECKGLRLIGARNTYVLAGQARNIAMVA